jgi:hypothetical protein
MTDFLADVPLISHWVLHLMHDAPLHISVLLPAGTRIESFLVGLASSLFIKKTTNSIARVREGTILTERPPLVGRVSTNFSGYLTLFKSTGFILVQSFKIVYSSPVEDVETHQNGQVFRQYTTCQEFGIILWWQ